MEPQLVLSIEPAPTAVHWPKLVRMAVLMTLIFALINLASLAVGFYYISRYPQRGSAAYAASIGAMRLQMIIAGVCRGLVDLSLAAAALYFLKFGRGYRLLTIALRLWLLIWILSIAYNAYLYRSIILDTIIGVFSNGIVVAAFPVLALLILREYSGDRAKS